MQPNEARTWRVRLVVALLLLGAAGALSVSWLGSSAKRAVSYRAVLHAPVPPPTPRGGLFASSRHGNEPLSTTLRGLVVAGRGGRALPQANVCLLRADERCCEARRCTLSDASGRFVLERTRPELDQVVASAAEHQPRRVALGAADLPRPSGEVLVIALTPGGVELAGVVVDALGGTIPEALVTASAGVPTQRLDDASSNAVPAVTQSGSDGRFRLSVPPGEVELVARAEAYGTNAQRVPAPQAFVTLVLTPETSIAGEVVERRTGAPLAGVRVTAMNHATLGEPPASAVSDADGTFRISGVMGGAYDVAARGPGWRSDAYVVHVEVGTVSSSLRIEAAPSATLDARVRIGNEPCDSPELELFGPESAWARGTADGAVRFDALVPGSYRATVRCLGALTSSEAIELPSRHANHEWSLSVGARVAGRVETHAGQPLPGAVLDITPLGDPDDRDSTLCAADSAGKFTCAGLAEGEWQLRLAGSIANASQASQDGTARVVVSGVSASPASVLIRSGACGSIRARLTSPGVSAGHPGRPGPSGSRAPREPSEPPEPLQVLARPVDSSPLTPVSPVPAVLRDGAFVFDRLPLGLYEIDVAPAGPPGGAGSTAVLARLDHHDQRLEITLPTPTVVALAGRVVDGNGIGVPGAWVRAYPTDPVALGGSLPALTDDTGYFVIERLVRGAYDVHAGGSAGRGALRSIEAGAAEVVIPLADR